MANHDEQARLIPDFLHYPWEFLFKTLGNDRKLPHQVKCLLLVALLYVPGLIVTSLTGGSKGITDFISVGWGFFISNILIGVVVWLLVGFLRKANGKLMQVSQIVGPEEAKQQFLDPKLEERKAVEKESWIKRIDSYRKWTRRGHASWWYYFIVVGGAIITFCICNFGVLTQVKIGWIGNNLFNELYFLAWFTALGIIGGACLFYIFSGFWLIRGFCKDVISEKEIKPLDPDHTGGLRELGRLALDLDLVVALPSLAFVIFYQQVPNLFPGSAAFTALAILYTLVLIMVFFISLSPSHDAMVKAKIECLLEVHDEYREMHEEVARKLTTERHLERKDFKRLEDLHRLYDRVEGMAVWPLDYRILLRFLVTSIIPLIASVISVSLSFPPSPQSHIHPLV